MMPFRLRGNTTERDDLPMDAGWTPTQKNGVKPDNDGETAG
jgi:hypothetical protein